jgi:hypothetical protein
MNGANGGEERCKNSRKPPEPNDQEEEKEKEKKKKRLR